MINQGYVYQEHVQPRDQGLTVLAYYTQTYQHSSGQEWEARIVSGQILLNDYPTDPDTCLQTGQHLQYHRPPWQEPDVPLTFEVIYEDPDLMVIAKPAGLPVLPGAGFLEHTLLYQLQYRYPHKTPVPIHRLGRGTSGLMLLARSARARAHLSQQMRNQQIHKIYRTLVGSITTPDQFTITQPIGKLPHPSLGYVYGASLTGLAAHSSCQVLRRHSSTTLLEVTIRTGRPHQIRIHLAFAGYPLLNDPLYGLGGVPLLLTEGKVPVPGDIGYHLHATQLRLQHPITKATMDLNYPPPPELVDSLMC